MPNVEKIQCTDMRGQTYSSCIVDNNPSVVDICINHLIIKPSGYFSGRVNVYACKCVNGRRNYRNVNLAGMLAIARRFY